MDSIAHPLSVAAIKLFARDISKRSGKLSFNPVTGHGHTWRDKFEKQHSKELTLRKPDTPDRGRSRMDNKTRR